MSCSLRNVLLISLTPVLLGLGQQPPFSVVEATIADMQSALQQRRTTSRAIVQECLERIARYEGELNAIISLNPRALEEADARDRERARGIIRGPLHGIPIALKDNIHTTDMPTTGGALAFSGFVPPYEATITKSLREAGAVIIAKTNMTELANWVASGMPGNYNALVGYGLNPYDPRRDPRPGTNDGRPALNQGGSSSGAGTAASFWAANVGTETSGSILTPANQTVLVGIKPTVGRVSRYGIIPITADQDTAGPMARTVADAAALLGVLEGAAPDARDPATNRCSRIADYSRFLDPGALAGARIGVPRAAFLDPARHGATMSDAIAVLKQQGATVVDPADIPNQPMPVCSGRDQRKGHDADCSTVFKYGMKRDFNAWLASLGPSAPVKTISELRQWNLANEAAGSIKYGQAQLDNSDEMNLEADRTRYLVDSEKDVRLSGPEGLDAVMKRERLDALLFAGSTGAAIAAKPGYPTVIVPFGFVPNVPTPPFGDGFTARPAPLGLSFVGTACSEPRLIALAYAFEQATRRRTPPPLFP
ncbi:MAG: amidase [Acidobacteria bacterium]|nr:amidase [Acidobacteriota bacterium]